MRRVSLLIALVLGCATAFPAAGQRIYGSGSTFVYPVLAKWSEAYQRTRGVHVEYQPIGSSGGLTEIRAEVVDFGISDAPLTPDQLLRDGLAQFPVVIGAIVPVVNLDGITAGQLRFTGQLLADIYLGKVKNWSDPAIAAVNPASGCRNDRFWSSTGPTDRAPRSTGRTTCRRSARSGRSGSAPALWSPGRQGPEEEATAASRKTLLA